MLSNHSCTHCTFYGPHYNNTHTTRKTADCDFSIKILERFNNSNEKNCELMRHRFNSLTPNHRLRLPNIFYFYFRDEVGDAFLFSQNENVFDLNKHPPVSIFQVLQFSLRFVCYQHTQNLNMDKTKSRILFKCFLHLSSCSNSSYCDVNRF